MAQTKAATGDADSDVVRLEQRLSQQLARIVEETAPAQDWLASVQAITALVE